MAWKKGRKAVVMVRWQKHVEKEQIAHAAGRVSDDADAVDTDVTLCAIPLSVGGFTAVKPNPKPDDLPVVVATALHDGTVTAIDEDADAASLLPALVGELEPKLNPAEPEPNPANPVKPLNAPACTAHAVSALQ